MPRLAPRHAPAYEQREKAFEKPLEQRERVYEKPHEQRERAYERPHEQRERAYGRSSSPFAMDMTAVAIGITLGVLALLVLAVFCMRHRRRPNYEEMPIMKTQQDDEETSRSGAPRLDEEEEALRDVAGAGAAHGGDANLGPQPLPPPHVLDASAPPPPRPHYSHLELRQLEGDGDTTHCWALLPPRHVAVRGESYLRDGQKVPSEAASTCLAVELLRSSVPVHDVARRADSPAHTLHLRSAQPITSVFVVNLIIPATDGFYQVVFYYGVLEEAAASPAGRLYARFAAGSDAFRNARLKLIPSVAEGPWLVKTGVGSRPSLLGKTLKQRFSRGEGYLEVDVDCNSSPAAGKIVSLVKSYARSLVVDLAFVIEAQTADELPERVIGCTRMMHIDLSETAVPTYVPVVDDV